MIDKYTDKARQTFFNAMTSS